MTEMWSKIQHYLYKHKHLYRNHQLLFYKNKKLYRKNTLLHYKYQRLSY